MGGEGGEAGKALKPLKAPPRSIPVPKPCSCVVGGRGEGLAVRLRCGAVRCGRAVAAAIRRDAAMLGRGGWKAERRGWRLEMGGLEVEGGRRAGVSSLGPSPNLLASLSRSCSVFPPQEHPLQVGSLEHPRLLLSPPVLHCTPEDGSSRGEDGPCPHRSIPVDMGGAG